ncbi:MAG TPA: MFS transporter [Anaerolineales bacterium]|nr:MFS transporter [Anaerolineales bacterium]HMV96256.1 MFS transporter [Anaerolineales bacterium]HMX20941.1 MFS transporter [Anaerolineales bacterium]HMX75905.1 MFS transporter [Anaerolineales bacterium]HMZ44595.1 MFS transporter [Anaerolineales bacterium]
MIYLRKFHISEEDGTMANVAPNSVSTRRERVAWYLYDFGNSAYASVVLLAVYSAYFQKQVVGGAEGSRIWGLTISIAMIIVAIAAPIMGAIADYSGAKKRFLFFFTALSVVFTAMLFFTQKGTVMLAIVCFLLAEIGYRAAQVFYDALLPEIASPGEMGRVAGTGWAIGSAGGIAILLLILPPILMTKSDLLVVRGSLIATAVFFAAAAAPIFLRLTERAKPQQLPPGENYFSVAFKQLGETIKAARGFNEFLKFMLAYLVYNEGVIIALDFAAILGAVLFGLEQTGLIIFFILVQATNVLGALLFGNLQDRFGGKPSLSISIMLMVACIAALYFAQNQTHFFIIGGFVGVAMAGVQSVSRAMVATFSPPGKSAEFFGFFALTGRTSSFIGPAVFGWLAAELTLWYQAQGQDLALAEQSGHRLAILSIAAFLIAGWALMLMVNEKKALETVGQMTVEDTTASK